MLGAKTILAKRLHDGSLEGEDARILTLLSVAYGKPVDPSVVGAIRRASKHARAGDECMASMHIALVPLPRLSDPSEAARRLFIADGLMEDGVSPRDIWTALDFDPAPLDALEKEYNPNQPRVPAGSGRPSGQWTREGAGSEVADAVGTAAAYAEAATNTVAPGAIRTTIATILDWAGLIARYGSGPATFLATLLYSPPAGGGHHEGEIPGRPIFAIRGMAMRLSSISCSYRTAKSSCARHLGRTESLGTAGVRSHKRRATASSSMPRRCRRVSRGRRIRMTIQSFVLSRRCRIRKVL